MGQTEKTPKTSWFHGLKQEFRKISWTDRKSVVKQTVAVVSVSVVVGLIIAVLDWMIQYGVDFLLGLKF
jgi:preprotein translocase subunit SecE